MKFVNRYQGFSGEFLLNHFSSSRGLPIDERMSSYLVSTRSSSLSYEFSDSREEDGPSGFIVTFILNKAVRFLIYNWCFYHSHYKGIITLFPLWTFSVYSFKLCFRFYIFRSLYVCLRGGKHTREKSIKSNFLKGALNPCWWFL